MITGLHLLELIAVGAYYGTGMEFTLGTGISVFVGIDDIDYNGIYTQVIGSLLSPGCVVQ